MPIIKNCLTDDFEDLVINSSALAKAIKKLLKNIIQLKWDGKKIFYTFSDYSKNFRTSSMNMWKNHFLMEKKYRKRRNKIMMMAPAQYVEQFENASYQEILKVKNELVSDISKFEHDYDREDPDWDVCPKPDVRYQWNLEALGLIAPMLSKAFNREYEGGKKDMEDYGGEMREFFGE